MERDLLSLLAHGLDDECISQALAIDPGTVPALVRTALTKLGIDPQPHPGPQPNESDAGQEAAYPPDPRRIESPNDAG